MRGPTTYAISAVMLLAMTMPIPAGMGQIVVPNPPPVTDVIVPLDQGVLPFDPLSAIPCGGTVTGWGLYDMFFEEPCTSYDNGYYVNCWLFVNQWQDISWDGGGIISVGGVSMVGSAHVPVSPGREEQIPKAGNCTQENGWEVGSATYANDFPIKEELAQKKLGQFRTVVAQENGEGGPGVTAITITIPCINMYELPAAEEWVDMPFANGSRLCLSILLSSQASGRLTAGEGGGGQIDFYAEGVTSPWTGSVEASDGTNQYRVEHMPYALSVHAQGTHVPPT